MEKGEGRGKEEGDMGGGGKINVVVVVNTVYTFLARSRKYSKL